MKLKWQDLTGERLNITEQKTGKQVNRTYNQSIKDAVELYGSGPPQDFVFVSQKGTIFSRQAINRFLQNQWGISSHGLRKSFGRHAYNTYGENDDILIRLSEIINHSSPKVTKTYLGIRQKELDDIFDGL